MRWLRRLLGQRGAEATAQDDDAAVEAEELRKKLNGQAAEIKKLTHSLYSGRVNNHLTEAILRAMRSTR